MYTLTTVTAFATLLVPLGVGAAMAVPRRHPVIRALGVGISILSLLFLILLFLAWPAPS